MEEVEDQECTEKRELDETTREGKEKWVETESIGRVSHAYVHPTEEPARTDD